MSWIWGGLTSFVNDTLIWLGWKNKEATILLLGLDNAGKSTLMHRLKYGRMKQLPPSRKPTMEEISLGSIDFKAYDMGGSADERPIWEDYFPLVDAIVFLVDAAHVERIQESATELQQLMSSDTLRDVPFLILGNKVDLPEALGPPELKQELGLMHCPHNHRVFMCSILEKQGYGEGLIWLGEQIP
eukprot:TRINITY_DN11574_c0_g1_i1.p1 TRINITY_DN11574_c0_g1~~TRINITY_DN11574_c0_g1_i1.p1  ORF type:complete len:186 (-),score=45.35 TRINITY_DN11574_c0_g1_i1:94-651(-)